MAETTQRKNPDAATPYSARRRILRLSFLIKAKQHLLSPGPMLAPLPESMDNQTFFNNGTPQAPLHHAEYDAANIFQVATELFHMACGRMEAASINLEKAAKAMNDVTAAMLARGAPAPDYMTRNDLDLRLGHDYAQARPEEHVHTLFQTMTRTVRDFATWFLVNATVDELNSVWIEFGDRPICSMSGLYIREWLAREADLNDSMAFAVVRLLNRDEGRKPADSVGKCLYVMHDWAARALQGGVTADECVALFDRPKKKFRLAEVTKIVPFMKIGEHWASVSIDLTRKSSLLIHPAASSRPYHEVEAEFRPLLQHLTNVALANMNALTFKHHYFENWSFGVALRHHQPIQPNNGGIMTLFYSIPQEDQFMSVSKLNLENAKQFFVHSLVKLCFPWTKKTIRKGTKRKRGEKKRRPDGKFAKESSSEQSSGASASLADQSQVAGSQQAGCSQAGFLDANVADDAGN